MRLVEDFSTFSTSFGAEEDFSRFSWAPSSDELVYENSVFYFSAEETIVRVTMDRICVRCRWWEESTAFPPLWERRPPALVFLCRFRAPPPAPSKFSLTIQYGPQGPFSLRVAFSFGFAVTLFSCVLMLRGDLESLGYYVIFLLALHVGHRLCINFSVWRANLLTTLLVPVILGPIYLMWMLTIVIYIN
jgi:hypothetical protein